MKEKIKNQKGFIQTPLLIGIAISVVVIVMIIGYRAILNQKPTTTTTSGSFNTKNTVQEQKTIANSYDYSKLSNKYGSRALYLSCDFKVIRSHEYLDPLLKDLEGSNEDKKINALLKLYNDSNFLSSEQITLYHNSYQNDSNFKSSLIKDADSLANYLKGMYKFEIPNNLMASGFLLTNNIFLTANHINSSINLLSQQYQQNREEFYFNQDEGGLKLFDFLFNYRKFCYVQSLKSSQKYPIKLPFTKLGSDIATGYLDQPIPTDNLQSFALCKESSKIGSFVYTPSYPEGEFAESFGKILNIIPELKILEDGTDIKGDIYMTDMNGGQGSSGGGVIVYTDNNDCLLGVIFTGVYNNERLNTKVETDVLGILPYIDKIKAIMQE